MSYVIAAPELVEAAAQNLAGIRSSLGQVTAAAAGPTTGVLAAGADEVSAAIAQLFGTYGQDFQALSAQAAAFHEEFVGLLNAGAGAYASAEAVGAQGLLSATASPIQALFADTSANLHSLSSALAANPAPLLNQLVSNQSGYFQVLSTGFANAIQNLPAELANVPANIQGAFQALATSNPGAVLQGIVNNQIGYANLIGTSLQHASSDLATGFNALPTSFQAANQAFAVGDITGGLKLIGGGFLNPFFSGFSTVAAAGGFITITPLGAVGDLLPIFSIPGQMAQNFTNLLPAGSIPAQLSQNFTNVVKAVTDTSVTSSVNLVLDNSPLGFGIGIDAHLGLPLALAIDALGGPVNGLSALGNSVTTFANAVQGGDAFGAATAVFNAPAAFVDGFLNGHSTLPLTLNVDLSGIPVPTTLNVPLNGILVPAAPYGAVLDGSSLLPGLTFNSVVTGTPLGGILPGLLDFLPRSLAAAIGASSPDFPPLT
jgi:PE family